MEHKYNKGSEWRKWDLHIHTPYSIENNYKGKNGQDVWESYITDLENLSPEIKVLGINDYLFIDGYKKVLEYKNEGRLANIELILPVVEFRLAKFCGHKQFKRINFHVIFSNEIKSEIIEQQFLNALTSSYKLDPTSKQSTWDGFLTKENLVKLGQKIINSVPADRRSEYDTPLKEGFNNLNLEVSDILSTLNKASSYFENKYITAIGKTEWDDLKWDDTSIAEKKTIINSVDIVFTAAESVDKYDKGRKMLTDNFVNNLLLDCSDSHNNIDCTSSKDKLGNCWTWIKADTTFEGLKQILCEPLERVKIQTNNPDEKKSYNVIEKVKFINGSEGKFSDVEIGFSSGLNAIIGGKSSGKSLLLHMMASEVGNTTDVKNYKETIGNTNIEVYYKDSSTQKRTKSDNRIIEFLPQLYIGDLVRNEEFKNTTVRSFNEFVEQLIKQDNQINEIISVSKNQISIALSNIDTSITEWNNLDGELFDAKDNRTKLGDRLAVENEMKFIKGQIEMLAKSAGWTVEQRGIYDRLIADNKEKEIQKAALIKTNEELNRLKTYIQNQLTSDFDNSMHFTSENPAATKLLIDFRTVLKTSFSELTITFVLNINDLVCKHQETIDVLNKGIETNNIALKPLTDKNAIQSEINKFEISLKEEQTKVEAIIAKDAQIENLRTKIKAIDFIAHYEIISDSYYALTVKLNDVISKKWSVESTKLDIKARTKFNSIVFIDSISGVISRKGYLNNQFDDYIFNTNEYDYNVDSHLDKLKRLVEYGIGEDNRFTNFKQGKITKEFLASILKDCFSVEYDIIKGSDSLQSMSEGKKGIVILQLYLSLSQSDCPILIDQPEDNLDNRTVYKELNDYIKQCKQRRQIIMVSHNANLVVNTDAENIIVANQSGEDGKDNRKFRFEYVNGSLENTFINDSAIGILYKQGIREHVCEILEGGVDAFKKREEKYHIKN